MSKANPNQFETECLKFACSYCGVYPGEWCRSTGGRFPQFLHSPRWRTAVERSTRYKHQKVTDE